MHIRPPPVYDPLLTESGTVTQVWSEWLTLVGISSGSVTHSGTTAERPTTSLFVGRPYFDTTLGIPIWLESVRPTVWVDATGTPA